MRYLIIGISFILSILFSCEHDKAEIEYIATDTYIYKNESSQQLTLRISNSQTSQSDDFVINAGESKTIVLLGNPGTAPFYGVNYPITADEAGLRFSGDKCVTYSRDNTDGITSDEGTGLFNKNNYITSRQSPLQSTNVYTITEAQYLAAPDCP